MASIARTTAQRTLTGISQPGRLFTTSASQFAGAKGKPGELEGQETQENFALLRTVHSAHAFSQVGRSQKGHSELFQKAESRCGR